MARCDDCGDYYDKSHDFLQKCIDCEDTFCEKCIKICEGCHENFCKEHVKDCDKCGHPACENCVEENKHESRGLHN